MKVASLTDTGRLRKVNEDSLFVDGRLGLLIVADGMGGHNGGEVASRIAVDTISGLIAERLADPNGLADMDGIIRAAIAQADTRIRTQADEDPALQDMGTTLVLALCRDNVIHLAHVGDSRAYLIRDGAMRQVTEDHSLMAQMLRDGQLAKEDAPHFRLRHVVTRSLGNRVVSEVEIAAMQWRAGDYLLLCSDGLTNMVEDSELCAIIGAGGADIERSCREAIDRANRNGGRDNITVILAYCD